jgi:hypothetical protein
MAKRDSHGLFGLGLWFVLHDLWPISLCHAQWWSRSLEAIETGPLNK